MLTIAKVRNAKGVETESFSLDLLWNGQKVAEVINDGWGGGHNVRWLDRVHATTRETIETFAQQRAVARVEQEEADYLKLHPGAKRKPNGIEIGWYPAHLREKRHDAFEDEIWEMFNDYKVAQRLARTIKKAVLFRLVGDGPLAWRTMRASTMESARAYLQKTYGGKLAVILNDLPEGERVARLRRTEVAA